MKLPDINPSQETEKITTFISSTFKKYNKSKAVVAVSGGIDSATSLILTTQALGSENILPIHLPSKTTNPKHTHDAMLSIKSSNIPEGNVTIINIGSIIQKSWRVIKHYSNNPPHHKKGEENKK